MMIPTSVYGCRGVDGCLGIKFPVGRAQALAEGVENAAAAPKEHLLRDMT